jgi:hypothetical protein
MSIPDPDLPIAECALDSLQVQPAHLGKSTVSFETSEEKGALIFSEKFGLGRPVDDEEFGEHGGYDRCETLDDKDPEGCQLPMFIPITCECTHHRQPE